MKLSTTKVALLFLTIMCLVVTKVIASHEKRHRCYDDDDDDCDWDEDWDDYDEYYDDDDWEHRGRDRGYQPGMPGMPRMPGVHEPLVYDGPQGRETAIVYPTTGMPAMVTATYSQVGSTTYYPGTGQVIRNSGSHDSSSASVSALAITAVIVMALNA